MTEAQLVYTIIAVVIGWEFGGLIATGVIYFINKYLERRQ